MRYIFCVICYTSYTLVFTHLQNFLNQPWKILNEPIRILNTNTRCHIQKHRSKKKMLKSIRDSYLIHVNTEVEEVLIFGGDGLTVETAGLAG